MKGGPARAGRMTGEERTDAARRAANARWHPDTVERLARHDHAAHLYADARSRLEQIAEFLHAGLTAGDRCVYVADQRLITGIARALRRRSLDVDDMLASGQLLLLTPDRVYIRDGRFDPIHTAQFWREFLDGVQGDGVPGLRAAAEMGWVTDVQVTPEALRAYETSINDSALIEAGARTICQFDQRRLAPAAMHVVLQTHRVVLLEGTARLSPFFEPPGVIDRGRDDEARLSWMLDRVRESAPPAPSAR